VHAMGILQQLGSHTRANPQLIQMVLDALYAHCPRCPRNLKERRNSIKDCPSTRLNYVIWRGIYSEGTLFVLAREKSAVHAAFSYLDKAVEDKNRYAR